MDPGAARIWRFSLLQIRFSEGRPINVFNRGNMKRDFTYIDDVVEGLSRVLQHIPEGNPNWSSDHPDPASSFAPYRNYNIGNNNPVELIHFIEIIETLLGKKAVVNFLPMQAGDVPETFADISDLEQDVGFKPCTPIEDGISKFIDWYRWYFNK